MRTDRESILAKIRALLAKTEENGCTEAEAMSALDKARALMDAYEVTDEDLEEAKGEEATIAGDEVHDPHGLRKMIATAVARFTDCRVWSGHSRRYHSTVRFCGLPLDVELATWLVDSLSHFVTRELVSYLAKTTHINRNHRNHAVNGFVMAAASRISRRLNDLADQSDRQKTSNGRSLVVTKNALIEAKMEEAGIRTRKGGGSARKVDRSAMAAGAAAGDRASFGRPVGQGGGVLRLK